MGVLVRIGNVGEDVDESDIEEPRCARMVTENVKKSMTLGKKNENDASVGRRRVMISWSSWFYRR